METIKIEETERENYVRSLIDYRTPCIEGETSITHLIAFDPLLELVGEWYGGVYSVAVYTEDEWGNTHLQLFNSMQEATEAYMKMWD